MGNHQTKAQGIDTLPRHPSVPTRRDRIIEVGSGGARRRSCHANLDEARTAELLSGSSIFALDSHPPPRSLSLSLSLTAPLGARIPRRSDLSRVQLLVMVAGKEIRKCAVSSGVDAYSPAGGGKRARSGLIGSIQVPGTGAGREQCRCCLSLSVSSSNHRPLTASPA